MTQQSILTPEEYKKIKPRKKQSKQEENLQIKVCNYIRLKYPHLIFNCDIASGMRLPIYIAAKCKKMRSGRGYPDLFIAYPKKQYHGYPIPLGEEDDPEHAPTIYHGLFLELKKEGTRLRKGNGSMASPHLEEQEAILSKLRSCNYMAYFAVGYDQAIKIIDNYLK
ncbi:MAG TPA: hypothetical protein ACFYEK_01320 [Candidatus Wunengus sp. YC60]|uniref:hypothetical protein n=1 Tax=Candidatus Wunengus sp. YC60 TaxID=3367697 RepID=UPI0040276FAD